MANTQINITKNGTKTLATVGKYCDRNIEVNVNVPPVGITPTGTKTITENGTHDVTNYANADVNVQTAQPTQFTNLYNPANVVIGSHVAVSSNVVSYTNNAQSNRIKFAYHHKAGETVQMRIRGIGTVRGYQVYVLYGSDGTTRVSHGYGDKTTVGIDEHGDTILTFASGSITNSEWYYVEFNFQYGFYDKATTALSGPIITINEPIGNGGHVG